MAAMAEHIRTGDVTGRLLEPGIFPDYLSMTTSETSGVGFFTTERFALQDGFYFYDAVLWAAESGIVSGTGPAAFSPDAACTRAQTVTLLWRSAGAQQPAGTAAFADIAPDAYCAQAVQWAAENGIAAGTAADTFSPDAGCTRAQTVTLLYRALTGAP